MVLFVPVVEELVEAADVSDGVVCCFFRANIVVVPIAAAAVVLVAVVKSARSVAAQQESPIAFLASANGNEHVLLANFHSLPGRPRHSHLIVVPPTNEAVGSLHATAISCHVLRLR